MKQKSQSTLWRATTVVAVFGRANPTAKCWQEYSAHAYKFQAVHGGSLQGLRNLTISDGGSPNLAQRKELNTLLGDAGCPAAVVTDSRLVQGAVIALSWFNPLVRAFSADDLDGALTHIKIPHALIGELMEVLAKLQDGMEEKSTTAARLLGKYRR